MKVEQKLNGFMLKLLAIKVDCEKCTTGHANKQCKKLLCKKCCLEDETVSKCAAHAWKEGGGMSFLQDLMRLRRCQFSSCV
jgi:hypothetical protein